MIKKKKKKLPVKEKKHLHHFAYYCPISPPSLLHFAGDICPSVDLPLLQREQKPLTGKADTNKQ